MKIALNLVLTLPDDRERPALLISCGIIDLKNDFIIECGPYPIYAHGSSFLPNPGIIMIIMVSRAEIIIIIINRIINYNCKSDYKL